jgi:hypothetical protein
VRSGNLADPGGQQRIELMAKAAFRFVFGLEQDHMQRAFELGGNRLGDPHVQTLRLILDFMGQGRVVVGHANCQGRGR